MHCLWWNMGDGEGGERRVRETVAILQQPAICASCQSSLMASLAVQPPSPPVGNGLWEILLSSWTAVFPVVYDKPNPGR